MSDLHDELRDCYHKIDRLERERDKAQERLLDILSALNETEETKPKIVLEHIEELRADARRSADNRAEVGRLREEVAWRQRLIDGSGKVTFIDRCVDDDTLVRLTNPAQIDLEKLKDEVERLQAARDKAESRADELEAHIDRAGGGEANLVALLDLYFEQRCKAERERDQARAEVERLRKVRDAAQTVLFAKENGHTTVEMFASHSLRSALDAAKEEE